MTLIQYSMTRNPLLLERVINYQTALSMRKSSVGGVITTFSTDWQVCKEDKLKQ